VPLRQEFSVTAAGLQQRVILPRTGRWQSCFPHPFWQQQHILMMLAMQTRKSVIHQPLRGLRLSVTPASSLAPSGAQS
jgi:hypothetical protein